MKYRFYDFIFWVPKTAILYPLHILQRFYFGQQQRDFHDSVFAVVITFLHEASKRLPLTFDFSPANSRKFLMNCENLRDRVAQ